MNWTNSQKIKKKEFFLLSTYFGQKKFRNIIYDIFPYKGFFYGFEVESVLYTVSKESYRFKKDYIILSEFVSNEKKTIFAKPLKIIDLEYYKCDPF